MTTEVPVNTTEAQAEAIRKQPDSLTKDTSFWGMTATQFLGAFNDNLYKQLILLICLDYVVLRGLKNDPYQAWAQAVFSLPFVILSGFSGWLSDRYSKRTIVVLSKVAEIGVMLMGLAVFMTGTFGSDYFLWGLMVVLCLMGVQSAFFGPAKYGILPELLRPRDLPLANGIVQMTTFLAIIFGTAVCGVLKQQLGNDSGDLWIICAGCVAISVLGTLTSLVIRPTRVAEPGLPLQLHSLSMDRSVRSLLFSDSTLRNALAAIVLFWFLGGVVMTTVNTLGREQLKLGDTITSILTACTGLGIGVGCVIAGLASRQTIRFGLVKAGTWGMCLSLLLLGLLPVWMLSGVDMQAKLPEAFDIKHPQHQTALMTGLTLVVMGVSAGVFAVPLQTLLQSRPPRTLKGRMIAAMNLCTWVGIFVSAGFYGACSKLFGTASISRTFFVLSAMILPLALLYRPADQELSTTEPDVAKA